MNQITVKTLNSEIPWTTNNRFKVGETCKYDAKVWINTTGANSEPSVGSDWTLVNSEAGSSTALETTYDNTDSGLDAENVKDAVDELQLKKINIAAVEKGAFTGPIDLTQMQGSVYTDYDVSVGGTITFSILPGALLFGSALMTIVSDGVTPFVTKENLDTIFFTKLGIPIDYVLPSGTFEVYFLKTLKGITISIPANISGAGGSINLLLVSATIETANRKKIILTFNRLLNETSIPATTDFTVTGGKTVTDIDVIGSEVHVTTDGNYGPTDIIEISYAKGVNPIEDTSGLDTIDFSDRPVTNNITGDIIQSTTGLLLYLDGSDADTIVDTAPDFYWYDKSSYNLVASQDGTVNPSWIPTYDPVNKKVTFATDRLFLNEDVPLNSRNHTVFMVIDFGASLDDVPYGRQVDNSAGAGMYWREATNQINMYTGANSSLWAVTDWNIYKGKKVFIIDYDKLYINGTITPDAKTLTASLVDLTMNEIGHSTPQVNKYLNGDLYCIGFYNRLLTVTEKDNINAFLMTKFDIT